MNSALTSRGLFSRFFWYLAWLGLAVEVLLTLWLGLAGLAYPYQLDYGEGIVLWFARQLAHGQAIYKGLAGLPYASSNYPPVAMLLSALLMPLLGDGYTGGRLLNFASALIIAGLIYRMVRVETGERKAGAVAAALFLGSSFVYHWVPLFRVDLIGLAFAFAGVYVMWLWERQPGEKEGVGARGLMLLVELFFLLSLYTKQTLVAGPAAAFFWLWQKNRRTALMFAFGLGAAGGLVYILLDVLSHGAFTFGLVTSNATVFLPEQFVQLLENFALTFPILMMLALWGLVDRWRARRMGIAGWYAVMAVAVLVMAGRMGAWENYFIEAIAALCVVAGAKLRSPITAGTSTSAQPNGGTRLPPVTMPVLLLLQVAFMWHDPGPALALFANDLPANRELSGLIAQTNGAIISEDMGALVTAGKPVEYYTFQYSSLARSGQWDQSWELNGLSDGAFPLVILERGTREDVDHYRRFTREFVSALDRYYSIVRTIGKYEIYAPAAPLKTSGAEFGDAITLVGSNIEPETLKPGTLKLALVWQARRAMGKRYKAFVHLEQMGGGKVTQEDGEPHSGAYPTDHWAPGEMVREWYTLEVPADLTPGRYVLRVGWYDVDTGDRLEVKDSADNAWPLATFEVTGGP